MPIADDWDVDFVGLEIRHLDGILSYDGNSGTAPSLNDYVRGTNSGAVGKVIAGSDLGGAGATGTLTLTSVVGRFQDNDPLVILSIVPIDTIANGGFTLGDILETLARSPTPQGTVEAIEYNADGSGTGNVYLSSFTADFQNNDQIDIQGGTDNVALVNGSETNNTGVFDGAANGTLAVPGTANENDSVIIHYDGGTIAIPEDARVADATTGAVGFAQQVVGAVTTGSIRLVDSDTTGGAWTNNNTLNIEQVVFYQNLVSGQVFSEGDLIVGAVSGAQGRVLAVIDDGDNTGKIILADQVGTFSAEASPTDLLQRDNRDGTLTTIAEVENATTVLAAAALNLPRGVIDEQRVSQGGVYAPGSLNVVRSANALFTYLQDTFDELGALDDEVPMSAQVRDQQYTLINGWQMPLLSYRFLESGAFFQDSNAEQSTNYQSLLTSPDLTDNGYLTDPSLNPTPVGNLYVEQSGNVLPEDWLGGDVNAILPVRTRRDPRFVTPATPTLGQLINGGTVTWFAREYLNTYDHFELTTVGGVAAVPLATADDLNNNTGQYQADYDSGSPSGSFIDGEEITAGSGANLKVGLVTADSGGATGQVSYVLKSGSNFADNEPFIGELSGKEATIDEPSAIGTLVAGYGSDIRTMVCDRQFSGGSWSGTPIRGELLTQTGTGATMYYIEVDDSNVIYVEEVSGTPNGTGQLTGGTSGATYTPTATAVDATLLGDLGNGEGEQTYNAAVAADITDANPRAIADVYEWAKYLTRKEESSFILRGKGSETDPGDLEGRIFRALDTAYAEVKAAPVGSFAGGVMFFARGWWIEKSTLDSGDIQNFQLIDASGTTRLPPNLQVLEVTNLESGYRAAAYRTTGVGQDTILRGEFNVGAIGSPETDANGSASSQILLAAGTRSVSPLPSDVPDAGVLRIEDPANPGIFLSFLYDTVDRANDLFTLTQGVGQNTIGDVTGGLDLVAGDDAHVVFIEEQAGGASVNNTIQFVANIPLLIVARKKGFLPFTTTGTFTNTGASVGIVRTVDPIVNLP